MTHLLPFTLRSWILYWFVLLIFVHVFLLEFETDVYIAVPCERFLFTFGENRWHQFYVFYKCCVVWSHASHFRHTLTFLHNKMFSQKNIPVIAISFIINTLLLYLSFYLKQRGFCQSGWSLMSCSKTFSMLRWRSALFARELTFEIQGYLVDNLKVQLILRLDTRSTPPNWL